VNGGAKILVAREHTQLPSHQNSSSIRTVEATHGASSTICQSMLSSPRPSAHRA
jgi:hypothetical protein